MKVEIEGILEKAFFKINEFWYDLNVKHKRMRWIPFILALYYLIDAIVAQYILANTLADIQLWEFGVLTISAIGFYYATVNYSDKNIPFILILSLFFLSLSITIFWFILTIFITYVIFRILQNHRIHRLKKLAESTPRQISGIKRSKPAVEITIRGNGK